MVEEELGGDWQGTAGELGSVTGEEGKKLGMMIEVSWWPDNWKRVLLEIAGARGDERWVWHYRVVGGRKTETAKESGEGLVE